MKIEVKKIQAVATTMEIEAPPWREVKSQCK